MINHNAEEILSEELKTVSSDSKSEILVILTGGTICSAVGAKGKRFSNAEKALPVITEQFKKSSSRFSSAVDFRIKSLKKDILSENMTLQVWNELLDIFREEDTFSPSLKGIIVLHGTDTLAYTSAFLSCALAGAPVPIFTVAAQLPPETEGSNAHANFRAAVELILNGIAPNVYTVYRNLEADGVTPAEFLLHLGSQLTQRANSGCNFHSVGETPLDDAENPCLKGVPFGKGGFFLDSVGKLTDGVLLIEPYPGLLYKRFNLEGVKAVVHGTYHSETVCVNDSRSPYSVTWFAQQLLQEEIPLILCPCDGDEFSYVSTAKAIEYGAEPAGRITLELAYARAVTAVSMGMSGAAIGKFVVCCEDLRGITRPSKK